MENEKKKLTIVLGASSNPARYSYLALQRLQAKGYPVIAIGNNEGKVGNANIITEHPSLKNVDTVTIYLNQNNQKQYYDYILSLHPARLIFNPGAENNELAEMARAKAIKPVEACTLVLLSTGQY